jgi:hypothetical protein
MSSTMHLPGSRAQDGQRLLGVLSLTIAGLGILKFGGLMAEYGPASSPWGFLLVLVVPFLVGRWLLPSHPRAGAIVIAVFAGLLVTACAVAVANGIEPYWADYLVVFVGGPIALVAVGLAVRVIRMG